MRAAVVGGGIGGLAAAHALAKTGAEVTVFEASGRLGGALRTTPLAGIPVEEGADAFLVRAPQAADLARLVGCELVHPATSTAWLLAGGRLRPLPAGTVLGVPGSLAQLRGIVTPPARARAALDLIAPRSRLGSDPAVGELVRRRLGPQVLDRLVDPLLGGVYAGSAAGLSVRAVAPLLADPDRSLLRTVASRRPPSASGPVFGSVVGGIGAFPAAVASAITALGGQLQLGVTVTGLQARGGGWAVLTGPAGRQQAHPVDVVVLALPAGGAARLLAGTVPDDLLPSTAYASVGLVSLVYAPGTPTPAGSGVLVAPGERRMVKALTFVGRKWDHATDQPVVIRASVGRFAEEADLQRPDVELAGVAAAEVAAIAAVPGRPIAWRVSRWGGALPQYVPGHLDRVAALRAALPAGLALAGAGYDGVGVPAVVASGQRAAMAVSASVGAAAVGD